MKRLLFWIASLIVIAPPVAGQTYKLSVPYERNGVRHEALATAVCIATSEDSSLLVTCRHNVIDDPRNVWVSTGKDWTKAFHLKVDPANDVATLEVKGILQAAALVDPNEAPPEGSDVVCFGFGPDYQGTGSGSPWNATIFQDYLKGENWTHPVQGDSGGPVFAEREDGRLVVLGIVTGYEANGAASRRNQLSSQQPKTRYVDAGTICRFIAAQYGNCPTCPPLYVRPEIRQPMIGIGIPVGPPRIQGVTEYRPPGYRIPERAEGVRGPAGERGPTGEPGPRGPAGPPGESIDPAAVEKIVRDWLEENRSALRGPAGPPGDTSKVDMSSIEKRLKDLEGRSLRMMIVDGDKGTVLDDEVYKPGEPVVLDLRRLRVSK